MTRIDDQAGEPAAAQQPEDLEVGVAWEVSGRRFRWAITLSSAFPDAVDE